MLRVLYYFPEMYLFCGCPADRRVLPRNDSWLKQALDSEIKARITLQKFFGTARVKLTRVPKKKGSDRIKCAV